jgi:CxxC motif-containing protein
MTKDKEITCIVCPIGCKILVDLDGKQIKNLEGNKCKQGINYAINEALDPRRMLTSSIFVIGGNWPLVSIKSSEPIPKNKMFQVLKEIKKIKVKAPIKSGQILLHNVANTNINIIATKSIEIFLR